MAVSREATWCVKSYMPTFIECHHPIFIRVDRRSEDPRPDDVAALEGQAGPHRVRLPAISCQTVTDDGPVRFNLTIVGSRVIKNNKLMFPCEFCAGTDIDQGGNDVVQSRS
jgi:hypothetical protein